jgi:DNA-binding IclR family transcriptional regulator
MIHFNKQIKKDILNYIKKNDGAYYGDIVKHLDYPANKLMRMLITLKQQHKVYKDNDGGQFKVV